jgi:hypothetical protein
MSSGAQKYVASCSQSQKHATTVTHFMILSLFIQMAHVLFKAVKLYQSTSIDFLLLEKK